MLLHRLHVCVIAGFVLVAASGDIFKDFFSGLEEARKFHTFFSLIDGETLENIESAENEAATFICQLAKGDVPDALAGIEDDIVNEASTEWKSLKSFVKGLPDAVPNLIDEFEKGFVDVADAVSGLVDNPKSEGSVLWHDFTSDIAGAWKGFTCDVDDFFGGQCSQSSSASAVWKTKCASVTTASPSGATTPATTSATATPVAWPSSAHPSSTHHPSASSSSTCSSSAYDTYNTDDSSVATTQTLFTAANANQSPPSSSSLSSADPSPSDSEYASGANKAVNRGSFKYGSSVFILILFIALLSLQL